MGARQIARIGAVSSPPGFAVRMPDTFSSPATMLLADDERNGTKSVLTHSHVLEKTDSYPAVARPVRHSKVSRLCEMLVDLALMACCLAFLAFALIVRAYDGARVDDHRELADALLTATTYVSFSQSWAVRLKAIR